MRRIFTHRSFALIAGIASIVLLVLLAGGISSLEFEQGTPFSFTSDNETGGVGIPDTPDLSWGAILSVVTLFILTVLVIVLATPKQRRILLVILLVVALILLGVMWWISRSRPADEPFHPSVTLVHTQQVISEPTIPSATIPEGELFIPPKVNPWISIGITFLILSGVSALIWLRVRKRWNKSQGIGSLAGIAEQAVNDLQSGKDYGDAVINCYAGMMDVVRRQRGIRRGGNLTPDEFIAVLERARLPSIPVRRLTAIFERVRYGGKKAGREEIDEAVSCLSAIASSIREAM
jgi:hypothetical protein